MTLIANRHFVGWQFYSILCAILYFNTGERYRCLVILRGNCAGTKRRFISYYRCLLFAEYVAVTDPGIVTLTAIICWGMGDDFEGFDDKGLLRNGNFVGECVIESESDFYVN